MHESIVTHSAFLPTEIAWSFATLAAVCRRAFSAKLPNCWDALIYRKLQLWSGMLQERSKFHRQTRRHVQLPRPDKESRRKRVEERWFPQRPGMQQAVAINILRKDAVSSAATWHNEVQNFSYERTATEEAGTMPLLPWRHWLLQDGAKELVNSMPPT
jgi:hypothetical protein